MDRKQLLWKMTAEQFAAFDTQLYLDTHQRDRAALQMFNNYQKAFMAHKREYESLYGPIGAEGSAGEEWNWLDDPWPWEKEAN
jgi:spore coat protein JB